MTNACEQKAPVTLVSPKNDTQLKSTVMLFYNLTEA